MYTKLSLSDSSNKTSKPSSSQGRKKKWGAAARLDEKWPSLLPKQRAGTEWIKWNSRIITDTEGKKGSSIKQSKQMVNLVRPKDNTSLQNTSRICLCGRIAYHYICRRRIWGLPGVCFCCCNGPAAALKTFLYLLHFLQMASSLMLLLMTTMPPTPPLQNLQPDGKMSWLEKGRKIYFAEILRTVPKSIFLEKWSIGGSCRRMRSTAEYSNTHVFANRHVH